MPPYRWLFFDADDTLFDYDLAEATALRRTFADSALPFDEAYGPLYQRINSAIWRRFEAGLITSEALRVERWRDLFAEAGAKDPSKLADALAKLKELLQS